MIETQTGAEDCLPDKEKILSQEVEPYPAYWGGCARRRSALNSS